MFQDNVKKMLHGGDNPNNSVQSEPGLPRCQPPVSHSPSHMSLQEPPPPPQEIDVAERTRQHLQKMGIVTDPPSDSSHSSGETTRYIECNITRIEKICWSAIWKGVFTDHHIFPILVFKLHMSSALSHCN